MSYNFSVFKIKLGEVDEWLVREYSNVRTGKATPQILDNVMVESYGSKMPIKHVAAISIEDAKTLRVSPWDKSQIGIIQKSIEQSNMGLSVSPDTDGLRLSFPALTEERRKMLMKIVSEKLEDGRISIKKEREKIWGDIQDKEKGGELSEDEKFKAKDELQKIVDDANKKLEEMADRKEKEIMN